MTIRGLSGSLLSHDALARTVPTVLRGLLDEQGRESARRELRAWHASVRATLGPTAGARVVLDVVAVPLALRLGYRTTVLARGAAPPYALLEAGGRAAAVLFVTPWGQDAAGAWRDAVRRGIGHDVRWSLCVTGPALRLFDAGRVYSRRFAEFDLAIAIDDADTFAVLWGLLRAAALEGGGTSGRSVLERAIDLCERHRAAVRESLKSGVHEALGHLGDAFRSKARRRQSDSAVQDESLIVIYRVLFLLFAEARGLVPQWHPVYRDAYTIESLRPGIESAESPRGLWESLQAIARLAHRGCRAGTLTVPAFNGRLFSPADAPLADSVRLDDEPVRRALLALTTRRGKERRERIAYADLGVEQLGAVYEHVLDYEAAGPRTADSEAVRPASRRKATGTFYTPRPLTEYLVRRTLAPLIEGARPDAILQLRVLDPAMGSGAFLVAACRYLARAYEDAVVRDGGLLPSDIADADRTLFRRLVAQRCLFGVDINPMAVQLARLSLWLATLAAGRPLTFLDHHLRAGDSLVGASMADVHRQPPPARGSTVRPAALPLFAADTYESGLRAIVPPRLALASGPDDTLEQVKDKERTLASLAGAGGPLTKWKAAADLWCAGWFSPAADRRTFGALLHEILDGEISVPAHVSAPIFRAARSAAVTGRFFHWTLEFPEAFYSGDGAPLPRPGFDAVLGNPPWEMLRADGDSAGRAAALTRFSRDSGIYALEGTGHVNLYQLFVERALSLLKPSGRLGFIVPAGLAIDHGCAALRRELLARTTIDTFATVENRDAIFPIHRGLKFTLFTLTREGSTAAVPARAGVRAVEVLDRLPDDRLDPDAVPLPQPLLRRMSGDQLAIPDIRSRTELDLVSRLTFALPALGDANGWNLRFGRELNATDDRAHFKDAGDGLAIVEGKHLSPFRVDAAASRLRVAPETAARLLHGASPFMRPRLAYRDVASATNRLTLIAAIVPPGLVTTHTVFCVKSPPDTDSQHFVCAIFNSFVANYLVRLRVGTHVTTALIDRLPVPRPSRDALAFREMAALARRLAECDDKEAAARHQALAAALYGLGAEEFAHVLDRFPLVPEEVRAAALAMFRYIVGVRPLSDS